MAFYNVDALVLRNRDFVEADKLVTLLGKREGKFSAVAKGARKPLSKLSAGIQPFTHGQFLLWEGRNLDGISQCQVTRSFGSLREDLFKMAAAAYLSELADELLGENDPQPAVFGLLLAAYHLLEEDAEPERVVRVVELRLLSLLGFNPRLDRCAACGGQLRGQPGKSFDGEMASLPAKIPFSPGAGGATCPQCAGKTGETRLISAGTLKAMRYFISSTLKKSLALKLPRDAHPEMEGAMASYLRYTLEKELKSRRFWERIMVDSRAAGRARSGASLRAEGRADSPAQGGDFHGDNP